MDLSERDRCLIWHPFTQEQTADLPTVITGGKGSYVFDSQCRPLLDLVSSWWVNIHGHAQPDIARQIYDQCLKLEHVIFAGFTHEPAVTLCENLRTILPSSLRRFFFTDNGSTAVEVALKMSVQYWKNKGYSERTGFIALRGSYHGDTVGAMSLGLQSGFHDQFSSLCFPVKFIPFPDTWIGDETVESKEEEALRAMTSLLEECPGKIAALLVEPFVQGAAGFKMCRPSFIAAISRMARERDILVVFDEIMTGFGRTGTYFALEQIGFVPDMICLSKGLTGGFLPLALTVTSHAIYESFLDSSFDKAFAHGHSYTANPVACAAANASFKLLTRPETMKSINDIGRIHREVMEAFLGGRDYEKVFDADVPLSIAEHVQRVRVYGTIAAFDVSETVDLKQLRVRCQQEGILIRPLHRSVYFLPPYSITPDELKKAYGILFGVIKSLLSSARA